MEKRILILPNIRSCHNVGAMFRTADACGFEKLYLVGYTAHPPKPQIDKVSLGAEKWIPWEAAANLSDLLERLKNDGVRIIALEKTTDSIPLSNATFEGNLALLVGNEVDGISEEILSLVDNVVYIPMHGKKGSLNVSVAAGIAMYTIAENHLV